MIKVYSVSLGCPKNRVDSERLLGSLGLKLKPVKRISSADLVFVNTCGFIEPAVRESVNVILECAQEVGRIPAGRRPLLAVAGCLVGRYGAGNLAAELPEVALWLPTADLPEWPVRLRGALEEAARENKAGCPPAGKKIGKGAGSVLSPLPAGYSPEARILSTGPSYAWLKISEGCGQSCSFCTIPQIRGKVRSLTADFLEAEARHLLGQGVSELVLVAQDLTSWGRDLKAGNSLIRLMERLLPLKGLERLRLMYLYPAGMTDEFLSFLSGLGKPFVPYFDLPLQHADPEILAAMGRPFAQSPLKVVERIRSHLPEAALRTTLITGFPGESEPAFERLYEFVAETRFQNLGVFAYEAEEGTTAAQMTGQVPPELKQERRNRIMELQAGISEEILEGCLGRTLEVLVDEPHPEWPGLFVGRAWFQAPEVDGVTYVSGENIRPGQLVKAGINEAFTYDLSGLAEE